MGLQGESFSHLLFRSYKVNLFSLLLKTNSLHVQIFKTVLLSAKTKRHFCTDLIIVYLLTQGHHDPLVSLFPLFVIHNVEKDCDVP